MKCCLQEVPVGWICDFALKFFQKLKKKKHMAGGNKFLLKQFLEKTLEMKYNGFSNAVGNAEKKWTGLMAKTYFHLKINHLIDYVNVQYHPEIRKCIFYCFCIFLDFDCTLQ